jgi:DNA-binding NarL/FixJ family response regulator
MKILLADDHQMIRQGLVMLIKQSYPFAEIVEANNSDELAGYMEKQTFDVVVSDLFMPGKPVIEVVKHARDTGNKVPIIILSMSLPERNAVRLIRAGANGYLNKDTAPDELINAIEFVLKGKKYITQEIASLLADAYLGDTDKLPHERLSDREFEVFQLLAQGKTPTQIAENLSLSINTVSTYKTRIMEKMNLNSFADIIKYAVENDLI